MISQRIEFPNILRDESIGRGALLGALGAVGVSCALALQFWHVVSPSALTLDVSSWQGWAGGRISQASVSPLISGEVLGVKDAFVPPVEVKSLSLPELQKVSRHAHSKNRRGLISLTDDRIRLSQSSAVGVGPTADEATLMQALRSEVRGNFLIAMGAPREARPEALIAAATAPASISLASAVVALDSHAAREASTEVVSIHGARAYAGPTREVKELSAPKVKTVLASAEPAPAMRRQSVLPGILEKAPVVDFNAALAGVRGEHFAVANDAGRAGLPMASGSRGTAVAASQPVTRVARTDSSEKRADSGKAGESGSKGDRPKLPDAGRTQARESLAEPPRLVAVEAFQLQEKVASAAFSAFAGSNDPLTAEWIVTEAPNHLPTLTSPSLMISQGFAVNSQRELRAMSLSENAASILGALVGAHVEKTTGLVVGRIPAGWALEFSGRAEQPVFLDDAQGQLAQDDVSKARWFALVNVEPGMHILSLVSPWSGERAAMSVPVLAGRATALPLSAPVSVRVRGVLLDASADIVVPLNRATLKRVGVEGAVAATDRRGRFDLGSQLWIPGTELNLEATPLEGFTHRYSLKGDLTQDTIRQLFAFPNETVRSWIQSLEGGVSDESGIVVAAEEFSREELDAFIRIPGVGRELGLGIDPLETAGQISTELYDLDGDRRLREAKAISLDVPRPISMKAVGVQVEGGLQRVQVESDGGARLWSTLVATSPGVINVVTR